MLNSELSEKLKKLKSNLPKVKDIKTASGDEQLRLIIKRGQIKSKISKFKVKDSKKLQRLQDFKNKLECMKMINHILHTHSSFKAVSEVNDMIRYLGSVQQKIDGKNRVIKNLKQHIDGPNSQDFSIKNDD